MSTFRYYLTYCLTYLRFLCISSIRIWNCWCAYICTIARFCVLNFAFIWWWKYSRILTFDNFMTNDLVMLKVDMRILCLINIFVAYSVLCLLTSKNMLPNKCCFLLTSYQYQIKELFHSIKAHNIFSLDCKNVLFKRRKSMQVLYKIQVAIVRIRGATNIIEGEFKTKK